MKAHLPFDIDRTCKKKKGGGRRLFTAKWERASSFFIINNCSFLAVGGRVYALFLPSSNKIKRCASVVYLPPYYLPPPFFLMPWQIGMRTITLTCVFLSPPFFLLVEISNSRCFPSAKSCLPCAEDSCRVSILIRQWCRVRNGREGDFVCVTGVVRQEDGEQKVRDWIPRQSNAEPVETTEKGERASATHPIEGVPRIRLRAFRYK